MIWDSYIKEFVTLYSREFSSVDSEDSSVEYQKEFDSVRSRSFDKWSCGFNFRIDQFRDEGVVKELQKIRKQIDWVG